VLYASQLSFKMEDYRESLEYYKKLQKIAQNKSNILEAHYGLMRNHFQLREFQSAIRYADKLLAEEKIDEKIRLEAMLIRAK